MQQVMARGRASSPTPGGARCGSGVKVAVAVGEVHRFVVGDPRVQLIDVLAGRADGLPGRRRAAVASPATSCSTRARSPRSATGSSCARPGEGERGAVGVVDVAGRPRRSRRRRRSDWPQLPEETARQWLLPAGLGADGGRSRRVPRRPAPGRARSSCGSAASTSRATRRRPSVLDAFVTPGPAGPRRAGRLRSSS